MGQWHHRPGDAEIWPMRWRGFCRMKFSVVLRLLCFVLLLFAAAWAWRHPWQNPLKVPVQANTKLLTITSETTSNTVTFPRAVVLSLALAVPKGTPDPFGGRDVGVEIWNGNQRIVSKSYSLASAQRCNWLDREGLDGFFLDNLEDQSPFIKSACLQSNASFALSISNAAIGSTVWLKYRRLSGWKLLP